MEKAVPHRVGLYLAAIQLLFTLSWTVYLIFLPRLAAQAGIEARWVPIILLLDQAIFVLTDFAMGVMADRMARVVGRLGRAVIAATLLSCLAFLLLPVVAPQGSPAMLLALTLTWAVTSSALRAPPLALLGKHAARPAVPWLTALVLLGVGLAGAAAPYLAIVLREMDPRLPFALSSIALALATLGIVHVERTLAAGAAGPLAEPTGHTRGATPELPLFLAAALLLSTAFQIHFSVNSAPLYLRHAAAADLPYLMPVFWIGFNLSLLPASALARRWGALPAMATGALLAASAASLVPASAGLETTIVLQSLTGAAWGCMLMSAVSAALEVGRPGHEGMATGALFSLLALAALARIAFLAAGLDKVSPFAENLRWAPAAGWMIAGVLLLLAIRHRRAAGTPSQTTAGTTRASPQERT